MVKSLHLTKDLMLSKDLIALKEAFMLYVGFSALMVSGWFDVQYSTVVSVPINGLTCICHWFFLWF